MDLPPFPAVDFMRKNESVSRPWEVRLGKGSPQDVLLLSRGGPSHHIVFSKELAFVGTHQPENHASTSDRRPRCPSSLPRFPLLPHHRAPQPAERGALCDLRRDQVELNAAVLHVRRVKNGTPSTHPLLGDEMRALRRLQRESTPSPFVFVRERGSPFTTAGFARMLERAAASAGLELKAHPHMLRHACGYALANKGHDTRATQGWLGHRSITSTAIYTALAPNRFKDFWRD
jgi:Phage integrase family